MFGSQQAELGHSFSPLNLGYFLLYFAVSVFRYVKVLTTLANKFTSGVLFFLIDILKIFHVENHCDK